MSVIAAGWSPAEIAVIGVGALSAAGGVLTWWANGIRAERTRLKKLYSDAFAAVAAHQQFPYIIHRRRGPLPGRDEIPSEERARIATALHAVQEAWNNYQAQIRMESATVSKAYESLVADARRITGGYMRDAWHESPITQDSDFPYALDFSALEAPKRLYLDAAMKDLRSFRVAFPWLRTRASR